MGQAGAGQGGSVGSGEESVRLQSAFEQNIPSRGCPHTAPLPTPSLHCPWATPRSPPTPTHLVEPQLHLQRLHAALAEEGGPLGARRLAGHQRQRPAVLPAPRGVGVGRPGWGGVTDGVVQAAPGAAPAAPHRPPVGLRWRNGTHCRQPTPASSEAARPRRGRPGSPEVHHILHHVEAERLLRQAAVHQAAQEGVRHDLAAPGGGGANECAFRGQQNRAHLPAAYGRKTRQARAAPGRASGGRCSLAALGATHLNTSPVERHSSAKKVPGTAASTVLSCRGASPAAAGAALVPQLAAATGAASPAGAASAVLSVMLRWESWVRKGGASSLKGAPHLRLQRRRLAWRRCLQAAEMKSGCECNCNPAQAPSHFGMLPPPPPRCRCAAPGCWRWGLARRNPYAARPARHARASDQPWVARWKRARDARHPAPRRSPQAHRDRSSACQRDQARPRGLAGGPGAGRATAGLWPCAPLPGPPSAAEAAIWAQEQQPPHDAPRPALSRRPAPPCPAPPQVPAPAAAAAGLAAAAAAAAAA